MKNSKKNLTEKVCKKCGVLKSSSQFYKNRGYMLPRCKPCQIEISKAYYLQNNGACREQAKKWRERHPARAAYLVASTKTLADPSSYPLNTTVFGFCELCGKETKRVHDHCHKTGKFRGMICHPCNIRLAKIDSRLEWHKKAMAYIKRVNIKEL